MKKLMLAIGAIALSATMAQATHLDNGSPPPQVGGEPAGATFGVDPNPVNDAWTSSAEFHFPVDPFDHRNPTTPDPDAPDEPVPLTIDMRMYKGCGSVGQCAYVDQIGLRNEANINQTLAPAGSIADIIQIGNDNKASIEQRFGASGPLAHYAVITQNGGPGGGGGPIGTNGAAIRQHSDIVTGATYADIQQGGDGTNGGSNAVAWNNWASIDQGIGTTGVNVVSYGNKAKIRQEIRNAVGQGVVAQRNMAAIIQRGDQMLALIDQDGDDNDASILQTGNGGGANGSAGEFNEARITQVGGLNLARIDQDGQFQLASIDQVGNNNNASIDQDGSFADFGTALTGNTAVIDQDGDFNTSAIMQTGNGNMASNQQTGNNNWSSIWQTGDDNAAAVTQAGDLNYSALTQDGNNNTASVDQNGSDWSDIQQVGNFNLAVVVQ